MMPWSCLAPVLAGSGFTGCESLVTSSGPQRHAGNQAAVRALARPGNAQRIRGKSMPSRTLRRARRSELQAYHKAKLSKEVQPIENQNDAVAGPPPPPPP